MARLSYIPEVIEAHIDQLDFLYDRTMALLETESSARESGELKQAQRRLQANLRGIMLSADAVVRMPNLQMQHPQPFVTFLLACIALESAELSSFTRLMDSAEDLQSLKGLGLALYLTRPDIKRFWLGKLQQSKRRRLLFVALYAQLIEHAAPDELSLSALGRFFEGEGDLALQVELTRHIPLANQPAHLNIIKRRVDELARRCSESQAKAGEGKSGSDALSEDQLRLWVVSLVCEAAFGVTRYSSALVRLLTHPAIDPADKEALVRRYFARIDPSEAKSLLRALRENHCDDRMVLLVVAAMKARELLPWVVSQMGDVKLARMAGYALEQITGLDLEAENLIISDEMLDAAWLDLEEDEALAWPDAEKIRVRLGIQT